MIEKILQYLVSSRHLKGGVLIFLPGWESIIACLKRFKNNKLSYNANDAYNTRLTDYCYFLPLHSQVPK